MLKNFFRIPVLNVDQLVNSFGKRRRRQAEEAWGAEDWEEEEDWGAETWDIAENFSEEDFENVADFSVTSSCPQPYCTRQENILQMNYFLKNQSIIISLQNLHP